jgi:DNA-binding HxlR family transcriptional regulator
MPATYGQSCPAARALEIVGERWTLLILRDLGGGPRRFADLSASLAGIAPNLLTERLSRLVAAGIVAHPPRGAYALTEAGRELLPVVAGLFTWGAKHLGSELELRHRACGHAVEVTIHCPCCGRPVLREECDRVPTSGA